VDLRGGGSRGRSPFIACVVSTLVEPRALHDATGRQNVGARRRERSWQGIAGSQARDGGAIRGQWPIGLEKPVKRIRDRRFPL